MKIGVPKEIKNHEYRVSVVPGTVKELVARGHEVVVQNSAGEGSGISDQDYLNCGAILSDKPSEIWSCDIVAKVKEPLEEEYPYLRQGQIIYAYFHFASSEKLLDTCLQSGCTAIAYETIRDVNGGLPLLTPMSEIAGRMAVQAGVRFLEKSSGGRGILLGGVPGIRPAEVVIIGGGIVGANAALIASGLGGQVTILDINLNRLRQLAVTLPKNVVTLFSSQDNIRASVVKADLVIGAVLLQGAKAPVLVDRNLVSQMKKSSVIVDVAVDQGGCIETCRPTSHEVPTYVDEGVIHYCVTNIPGIVSHSSTYALTNATAPFLVEMADLGWKNACFKHDSLKKGVNVHNGEITHESLAASFGRKYVIL